MGLISMITKAGVAKKVYSEARKPQNQQKVKGLINKVRGKGGSASGRRAA